ncbi:hypothetical protein AAE02nite_20230 [Adhaeribacter aerolatus]|uniref:Uncharacterized protein n=1 Tax=Adhaeribacter aerolatus TaxID=670289 RepID=A0A512AXA9_9BACT|nr:hypothetical protein [Adhaeribacter aerolatus]GEO04359.1 hypothetical protein AAE02nite_20230 [Adhaeribacter aerolatus]
MNNKISNKRAFTVILVWFLLLCGFQNKGKIRYFQTQTVSFKPHKIVPIIVDFQDSTFNDTLFQIRSKENYPVSYFRKIQASVCFDDKCRLLDIVLYWNITGRYLGFEMPDGEYLSKTDHDPFQPGEYKKLNQVLADPNSPMGTFTYEQLTLQPPKNSPGVDATTSPIPPLVAEHIVQGAAYTTYKLWHFIYGRTQTEVRNATLKALTPTLMKEILASPDEKDKMWALNHINGYVELTPELQNKVVALIDDKNFSLAERAVNAINKKDLGSKTLQLLLLDKFYSTDYSLKKLIIDKLKQAPELDNQVKANLAKSLNQLNGEILSRVLDVFKQHKNLNKETLLSISELLLNENAFISRKAFDFFQNIAVKDQEINNRISKYKATQGI